MSGFCGCSPVWQAGRTRGSRCGPVVAPGRRRTRRGHRGGGAVTGGEGTAVTPVRCSRPSGVDRCGVEQCVCLSDHGPFAGTVPASRRTGGRVAAQCPARGPGRPPASTGQLCALIAITTDHTPISRRARLFGAAANLPGDTGDLTGTTLLEPLLSLLITGAGAARGRAGAVCRPLAPDPPGQVTDDDPPGLRRRWRPGPDRARRCPASRAPGVPGRKPWVRVAGRG